MHPASSKVENSAQGSSCKLKFVHELFQDINALRGATTLSITTLKANSA
jgi:hypothetical protein